MMDVEPIKVGFGEITSHEESGHHRGVARHTARGAGVGGWGSCHVRSVVYDYGLE